MKREFNAQLMDFQGDKQSTRLTACAAMELIRDRRFPLILLDVVPEDEIDLWWNDPGFPPVGASEHRYHKALVTSGNHLTLGQLQRSERDQLIPNLADYFTHAAQINPGMKTTRFVRFFLEELDASPLKLGDLSEFMLATKRVYPPFDGAPYSFAPHCDALDFGRATDLWPIKLGREQCGAWMLIHRASNEAAFVLWDLRPESRAHLDALAKEYTETHDIAAARSVRSMKLNPTSGQLVLFNSGLLHAVEKCASPRHTFGTFLIEHDGGWKLFH